MDTGSKQKYYETLKRKADIEKLTLEIKKLEIERSVARHQAVNGDLVKDYSEAV